MAAAASGSGGSGGGGSSKTPASTDDATTPNPGLGLKAVWVGAEALGNVIGATKGGSSGTGSGGTGGSKRGSSSGGGTATMSRQQAIEAIKADYEANYFVSGVGSMEAYAPDCLFADPFASFKGTQRFKNNVSRRRRQLHSGSLALPACSSAWILPAPMHCPAGRCPRAPAWHAPPECAAQPAAAHPPLQPPSPPCCPPALPRPRPLPPGQQPGRPAVRHPAGHHSVRGGAGPAGAHHALALQRNPGPALAPAPGSRRRHHARLRPGAGTGA